MSMSLYIPIKLCLTLHGGCKNGNKKKKFGNPIGLPKGRLNMG